MNDKYTRELRRNIAGLIGLDLDNAWYKHTCDDNKNVTCEACEEEKRMLEKRLRELHVIRSEVDVIFDDIFDSDEDVHSIKRIYVRNGEKGSCANSKAADNCTDSSDVDVNVQFVSGGSSGSDKSLISRVINVFNGFVNKSSIDDNNNTEE